MMIETIEPIKEGFEIKDSPIEGKGLFATRDFQTGEVVAVWDTSHVVSPPEIEKLPADERRYVTRYGNTFIVLQPPSRYMNHSCDANTRSEAGKDVAIRDIKKGEEITADYRSEMVPGDAMSCNCGSAKCVGVVQLAKYE